MPRKAKAKVATSAETVSVYVAWNTTTPDPVQYKPYAPVFAPSNGIQTVYVKVEVPSRFVVETVATDTVVLTPAGAAYVMKQLAMAVMESHTGDSD